MTSSAVQTSPKVVSYLTENIEKKASSLRCKALTFNVLEKISWVALIGIMAVVLTVSYSGVAVTGTLSLVLAATVLSTVFFAWGVSQFRISADRYARLANDEKHVVSHLKKIGGWDTARIQQFFREEGIRDLEPAALQELKKINDQEPLKALLPLIARFYSVKEMKEALQKISNENLTNPFANIPDLDKRQFIRLTSRQEGWKQYERGAVPKALEAAVLLEMIQNPTANIDLLDLGQCREKTYEERMFDRNYPPLNDDYFIFNKNLNRPSLSLAEIDRDMEPRALRAKLFPERNP